MSFSFESLILLGQYDKAACYTLFKGYFTKDVFKQNPEFRDSVLAKFRTKKFDLIVCFRSPKKKMEKVLKDSTKVELIKISKELLNLNKKHEEEIKILKKKVDKMGISIEIYKKAFQMLGDLPKRIGKVQSAINDLKEVVSKAKGGRK